MTYVRLAGGILWREVPQGMRLALIHRPRQADWSLPKGRVDEGETWEEAALREVEEETGCQARISSFAGAAIYVPRRAPRLVLYWHMLLQREDRFEANKEVDELIWLSPADALARLDSESERRLVQRSTAPAAAGPTSTTGSLFAGVAAARAEILRRIFALPADGSTAGLGPALDLLDRAEEASGRGESQEATALAAEARRMGLLSLTEPELSLRARELREEARALVPWRRRAIRRLLPKDEKPSPEAVHLAAELRDQDVEQARRPARLAPALCTATLAALALVLWLVPPAARGYTLWAALCGSLAGAAVAALYAWRSGAR
ncbi:MAG: NUDIX domain-containing protein [Deltaproteobacteria bacterium]|nr:MAG: NUDIX domain-containing protein [Deltaproteobacteria bacterium]